MRRTIPLVRHTLSMILAALAASLAVHASEIRGRILGDGAKPLAGAVIRLLPDGSSGSKAGKAVRADTAADGGFVATGLTGDVFRIRVEAKGYAPLTQSQIPAGATLQLRLRAGVKISGIVRDRSLRTPIAGAIVFGWEKEADPFGEEAFRKATSGKDGGFVLEDIPAGKVTVEARAKGHAPGKTPNVVAPKTGLELVLDLAGGLTGVVTDTVGDPVVGAVVTASLRGATGTSTKSAKTAADGHYRIGDAAPDVLAHMSVRALKFLLEERDGPAPQDGVVDFMLQHGGSIAGTVRGYDGKTLPSFQVKVHGDARSPGKSHAEHEFNDPSGAFRLDDLEPGMYAIEVSADRYASVTKTELDVAPEQVRDAGTLTLLSRAVMRGRVIAARDRAPIAGASVEITLVGGGQNADVTAETSWSATSGPDGTFKSAALPGGTFELALAHPQFAPARMQVTFEPDADAPEIVVEMSRGGALTGAVVDAKLEPVAGVRIVATQETGGDPRIGDTGSDGHYFIDGLAPGTWTVTRQQERPTGSASVDTKYATIREGETTTIDFDEKSRVTVSGMLMKGDAPIPNAPIYFVAIDTNLAHDGKSTQSDAQGAFQVGLLHGGKYQVSVVFGAPPASPTAAASASAHNVVTLNIPDQAEVHQDIVFTVHAITGHVHDAERKGVKGALVTAVRDGSMAGDAPRQSTTTTLDDGSFKIDAVDTGAYRVTARARSYTSADEYPVAVTDADRDPDLDLTLKRGWIMAGHLLDPQGRGVSGALVVVAPTGAAESGYLPATTDASGGFKITASSDGPINVAAIPPQYAPAIQNDVEQPPDGGSSDVVLHATPGGSLRVRVVKRSGGVVGSAQLAVLPVPLFPGCDVWVERIKPMCLTDADGTALITKLAPGTYLVSYPGRRDVAAVQVFVNEGTESAATIEVP